jgi:uncharacterized membrane protein (UPF0182 family)
MKDEILGTLCPFSVVFAVAFALNVLYLLGSVASLLSVEPGTESHAVALLTIVISLVAMAIVSPVLYYCRQYNRAKG